MKKMEHAIAVTALGLKKAKKALDRAAEAIKLSENKSAEELFYVAVTATDRAADHLVKAIQLDGKDDPNGAAYYCRKAEIMTSMAYRHAELAIKEAAKNEA